MSHIINLRYYNKNVALVGDIEQSAKKIANINNHLFVLTSDNKFYKGLVAEEDELPPKSITLQPINSIEPVDIASHKDNLFIVNLDGSVSVCNDQLDIVNTIELLEEYKCVQGHNSINRKVKVKSLAVGEYGKLFITENDQMWGCGQMPQIGLHNDKPKKIVFFSGRSTYNVCVGSSFAVVLVSKNKVDDLDILPEDSSGCNQCTPAESLESPPNASVNSPEEPLDNSVFDSDQTNHSDLTKEKTTLQKNIIFRNTEAAKEFLTKHISRMSSVGEEYLIECAEKPTRIIKENVTNVASFVYEGVKTMGDKVVTLSRHVSTSSECINGMENNEQLMYSNSKEDFRVSGSQSTSERDLSDMEIQERIDSILGKGLALLNREVWMWGNVKRGSYFGKHLGSENAKKELPMIISALTNSGVGKISLQAHHACAVTLDGRSFFWGQNNYHQVNLEANVDQLTPKLFQNTGDQIVLDAVCGNYYSNVLTDDYSLSYFGKDTDSYQSVFQSFPCDIRATTLVPLFTHLTSSEHYSLINVSGNCDDNFSVFMRQEQIMLEEMIHVNQHIIKMLSKKSSEMERAELYDILCKSYQDLLHFTAANVESLLQYRNRLAIQLCDITIVKHFKEFMSVYKVFFDVVQNVIAVNGFAQISKYIELNSAIYGLKSEVLRQEPDPANKQEQLTLLLLSPIKRLSIYMAFFDAHFADLQVQLREFDEYVQFSMEQAEKTKDFWSRPDNKMLYNLLAPDRRLIMDSQTDPVTLQNAGRFSSHRFVLFSDCFAHVNGSSSHLFPLRMIWLEVLPHDSLHLLGLRTPEELLVLAAPDGVQKNNWYHALQQAIKAALNKTELHQPPLARSGTYTFGKVGFFHQATYTGRWLSGKMQGSGKIKWEDGRSYNGQFSGNFLSGFGTMEIPNVGVYEGEWKDNKQNGYGVFTYSNNDIYKGYFRDGVPHGHGLLRKGNFMANSASLYIGEWVNGKKSGYGVMDEISTGKKYLGTWAECKREGNGLIVTSDGIYFEGNFHNDLLWGSGIMVLEDGTHYEGEFKGTGLVGGKGTLTLPSGHTIEGTLTGTIEEGIKITNGIFRKSEQSAALPNSFGQLCTPPSQKWKALFKHCCQILGFSEEPNTTLDTPKIWQNVAVHLAGASTLKGQHKWDDSLQNSLNRLDVIPPFGRDKLTLESYGEIQTYLNRAFDSSLHPLGVLLDNLCEAYISSYSGKVHPILVNHAISEIVDVIQRVYNVIRYLFPALPVCNSECVIETEQKCEIVTYQSLLYPVILPKVYNCLCTLLTLKNEQLEKQYKKVLIEWNKLTDRGLMGLLGVEKKFFNLDRNINVFVEAIETLQQIISVFLPIEKLIVIRKTVEKMTPVAQELLGASYVWNMDDLFPLFLYVVVRARIPHLGAELEFMENFMDKHLENGELGIMFTTLKACYQQLLQEKSYLH